jgi:hypothetical protein
MFARLRTTNWQMARLASNGAAAWNVVLAVSLAVGVPLFGITPEVVSVYPGDMVRFLRSQ